MARFLARKSRKLPQIWVLFGRLLDKRGLERRIFMALCGHGAVFQTVDGRRRQTVGGRKTAGISLKRRLSRECLCGVRRAISAAGERILLQTHGPKTRKSAVFFAPQRALFTTEISPQSAPYSYGLDAYIMRGEAALWRVFAQNAKNC